MRRPIEFCQLYSALGPAATTSAGIWVYFLKFSTKDLASSLAWLVTGGVVPPLLGGDHLLVGHTGAGGRHLNAEVGVGDELRFFQLAVEGRR